MGAGIRVGVEGIREGAIPVGIRVDIRRADGNGGGQNPRGGGDHTPYVDGKKTLDRICGETGGRVFEVSKKQSVDDIYKQIGAELRSQYRLGFTPAGDAAKDRYHQISLGLSGDDAKKKMDVQVRDGYYMGQ